MKYYTKEEDDFLLKYYTTKGQKWCSEQLKRTTSSIKTRTKILNLSVNKKIALSNFTEEDIIFLKENYSKIGPEQLSILLKKSKRQILRKSSEFGLKVSNEYIKKMRSETTQNYWDNNDKINYKISPDIFKNINIPELSYVLGILWSDGNVYSQGKGKNKGNRISVEGVFDDYNQIKKQFLKIGDWNIYTRKRPNKQKGLSILTNNRPLCEYLITMDFDKKSKVGADKILTTIPDDLKHYFVLGFFDGDGCVYIHQKNIRNFEYEMK